jgi:hypothetical protein
MIMKKIILLAALVALFVATKAQVIEVKQVPSPIVTTFQSSYPSASNVVWRKSGNYYVADYSNDNVDSYTMYEPSGKVYEYGVGVADESSYPANLTTYVKTKYKNDHIKRVYKVKDANGKTLWKGKVKEDYLLFDENGNYIKMEKD